MGSTKGRRTEEIPKHRVLRDVYRHMSEFRAHVQQTGDHVIEHGYYVYDDDGIKERIKITISYFDLFRGLKELSPRKREAMFWNVVMDQKQRDVAKLMGITTVSVGQYVEQACQQLAENYFPDDILEVEYSELPTEDNEPKDGGLSSERSPLQPDAKQGISNPEVKRDRKKKNAKTQRGASLN